MAIPEKAFKLDTTISLSSLIAMVGIMVSIIATASVLLDKVGRMGDTMEKQGASFQTQLDGLKSEVSDLAKEMAVRNAQASAISDHENRLRELERGR